MRDRKFRIKTMSPALLVCVLVSLVGGSCEDDKKPSPVDNPGIALPEGVLFRPESPFSPALVLEPREGKPHLLHVEVRVPDGQQLLRLRLLRPGPGFAEMASKDTSEHDSPLIKESFEIAAKTSSMEAQHVLVIADYESGSYATSQALPNF